MNSFRAGLYATFLLSATPVLSGCMTTGGDLAKDEALNRASPAQLATLSKRVRGTKDFFEQHVDLGSCDSGGHNLKDLAVQKIGISNRDVPSSVSMLIAMGYSVIGPDVGAELIPCEYLPAILVPDVSSVDREMLSLNSDNLYRGTGNLNIASLPAVNSVDLDELIVFYHPSQAADITRLRGVVETIIDAESPQVYIETMVLEVSEEVSRDLGVQYTTGNVGGPGGNNLLSLGALEPGDGDAFGFTRNTRRDADGNFEFQPNAGIEARIRALVANDKAEVLASPSVIALSNRQAVIQIVDVVQTPLVQSAIGGSGELLISGYTFEPLLLGITLNLRPRISADRQWVSLEIDATVESEIDENSGIVFAPDGQGGRIALAEKRGSASRKVKTVARIPDRTPIVIGGLIAGKREVQEERVPLIGEIPVVGALFGTTDRELQKREIVIVLTPHVLAAEGAGIQSQIASMEVLRRAGKFRVLGGDYRLLTSDVYDLDFIEQDAEFQSYRNRAAELVKVKPELANDQIVGDIAQGRVPGYRAIFARTLYDVLPVPEKDRGHWLESIQLPIASGRLVSLKTLVTEPVSNDRPLGLKCISQEDASCRFEIDRLSPGDDTEVYDWVLKSDDDLAHLFRVVQTNAAIQLNHDHLRSGPLKPGDNILFPRPNADRTYELSAETLRVADDVNDMVGVVKTSVARSFAEIDKYSASYGLQSETDE